MKASSNEPPFDSEESLRKFYHENRPAFFKMAARYPLGEEEKLDVYQDAMIALVEGVREGKIDIQKKHKTYLMGIARNMLVDKIKGEIRAREMQKELMTYQENTRSVTLETIELTHRQQQLKEALDRLGEKCREILILFYYRKYSIDAIRTEMNYNSDNVVKAHKSRCLKQLREIIRKKTSL